MGTALNSTYVYHLRNSPLLRINRTRDFIHAVIRFRVHFERCEPLNIGKVGGKLGEVKCLGEQKRLGRGR